MRRLRLALSVPLIVGGMAVVILVGNVVSMFAGAVIGLGVCIYVLLWDTPPDYVENWSLGAEGERKTERALRSLERAGWCVVHDVKLRYGNYDHIAVGPAGVFLLETKNLRGTVEVQDEVPYLQRRFDPEDNSPWRSIPRGALRNAATLKEDLEQRTGHRTWVQAVVVFWSDFPEGLKDGGRCIFVHGSALKSWLEECPQRLSPGDVSALAAGLRSLAEDRPLDDAARISEDNPSLISTTAPNRV
jgi:hypothetical protein